MKVLYITYDGLTDPLGRSQVMPYLEGCAERGHRIVVISCEKPCAYANSGAEVRELCNRSGIEWHPLTYHKSPPIASSAFDIAALTKRAFALHREHSFDLVHCRSHMPGIVGLRLKAKAGLPLLFDMRSFWPDEKVEAGTWRLTNPVFRLVYEYFKGVETRLIANADCIVSLTSAAKQQLLSRPALRPNAKIEVIPCSVDFNHFPLAVGSREQAKARLGISPSSHVLAYLGSLGGNYMLAEMLDFFRAYRAATGNAVFLFVTADSPQMIEDAAAARGIDPAALVIRSASRDEVPQMIAAADTGIAFKQASFSALACSPTKIGEMLAMGLPVVANSGVGDVEPLLTGMGAGEIVKSLDEPGYDAAARALERLKISPEEIRRRAKEKLDLETAIETYSSIYEAIGLPATA